MYFYAMKSLPLLSLFLLTCARLVFAQGIDVRYDKNRDMSVYKTFGFGEGEVITPPDERVMNESKTKGIVIDIISEELIEKGLTKLDSGADLTVSFIVGAVGRTEINNVGPLGGTPGQLERRSNVSDTREGSLVITIHDKSKHLVWRINGSGRSDLGQPDQLIREVVVKGFKKFSIKPPKKKKK